MPIASRASGQPTESPTAVVRATLTEVFRILDDPKLKDPAKPMPRRRLLEQVIGERFDYTEMSDRYAGRIEGYSGERTEYLSERLEGQYAEVRTKLVSGKTEIPMDYRLMNKAGRWYAYDIIADGISLVKNYRSQFDKIIRSDSYNELVKRPRNRTVAEEKQETR